MLSTILEVLAILACIRCIRSQRLEKKINNMALATGLWIIADLVWSAWKI